MIASVALALVISTPAAMDWGAAAVVVVLILCFLLGGWEGIREDAKRKEWERGGPIPKPTARDRLRERLRGRTSTPAGPAARPAVTRLGTGRRFR